MDSPASCRRTRRSMASPCSWLWTAKGRAPFLRSGLPENRAARGEQRPLIGGMKKIFQLVIADLQTHSIHEKQPSDDFLFTQGRGVRKNCPRRFGAPLALLATVNHTVPRVWPGARRGQRCGAAPRRISFPSGVARCGLLSPPYQGRSWMVVDGCRAGVVLVSPSHRSDRDRQGGISSRRWRGSPSCARW